MTPLTATRNRLTAPFAALLLVLQGLAGGAVPLAHATDRFTAAAHIEAADDAACVILHDGLRCALCIYAGTRAHPQCPQRAFEIVALRERPAAARGAAGPLARLPLTSAPRAPPLPLV